MKYFSMKRLIKNRFQYGYYATIAYYKLDTFTEYYIDRFSNGSYRLLCHMSGAGTDQLKTGSLADCYNSLKKAIA
jgi:hypothetical protein